MANATLIPTPLREADVLEMIARHSDLRRILETLCLEAGETEELQLAFFLLEQGRWELAATGTLDHRSNTILSEIVPEAISASLFTATAGSRQPASTAGGRILARQLYSGIGELLGLFICLSPEREPGRTRREKLDAICRLAALAIEQRNLLQEMTWQADHDAVTGVYSRPCFDRMLISLLSRAASITGTSMLCINLDRFRLVNGVLGHTQGNRILQCAGARFQSCLPPGTMLARVGGDEFAVLIGGMDGCDVAGRLLQALSEPFAIDDHQIYLGASIGISSVRYDSTPESLQREAYIALYHAKQAGKGRWIQFDPTMAAVPPERLELEKCLRSALANGEFELYYQPQIELATGLLKGAEALLRWKAPGLGSISPTAFIPILEETGQIVEIGSWVLEQACRQGVKWRRENGISFRLAVNASSVQFRNPGFAEEVERILTETGFPPELLDIELTESIFIGDFAEARRVFDQLQKLGIAISIDDFGTGQSSLSYLHKLPFQRLKLDRTFVAGMSDSENVAPILKNIIHIAGSLGMVTVAEGIEQRNQLAILRSMGCDEGQGFYFARPLPADEFLCQCCCRRGQTANCSAGGECSGSDCPLLEARQTGPDVAL